MRSRLQKEIYSVQKLNNYSKRKNRAQNLMLQNEESGGGHLESSLEKF